MATTCSLGKHLSCCRKREWRREKHGNIDSKPRRNRLGNHAKQDAPLAGVIIAVIRKGGPWTPEETQLNDRPTELPTVQVTPGGFSPSVVLSNADSEFVIENKTDENNLIYIQDHTQSSQYSIRAGQTIKVKLRQLRLPARGALASKGKMLSAASTGVIAGITNADGATTLTVPAGEEVLTRITFDPTGQGDFYDIQRAEFSIDTGLSGACTFEVTEGGFNCKLPSQSKASVTVHTKRRKRSRQQ